MKQWYEQLFENYAERYDKESFTQGTIGEADFIEAELNYDKRKHILDIGCGTGRHAVELAARGYKITGIDLSEGQLTKARSKAEAAGVKVDFLRMDARAISFSQKFDAAIMLCEGGFSLMETDEMNFEILKGVRRVINPGGKFIFTTLNALFPIFHSVKDFLNEQNEKEVYTGQKFDLMTFRESSVMNFTDDDGKEMQLNCSERFYTPSEITWLLKSIGFKVVGIYGAKLGAFSRNDKLTTNDFEMLVIAE